jgi:hypothetical protein
MIPMRPYIRVSRVIWLLAVSLVAATSGFTTVQPAPAASPSAINPPKFNRDIRPILSENCFGCHGPDSAARKADLRFDRREVALSLKAIVPSKPDDSEMIRRINSDDPDERMPPPASGKKLTAEQKTMLRQWIAAGAEYQPLWSFIAPKRSPLPAVKNTAWAKNPIDRFVLAKIEQNGLQPAPEANRRTLARRACLDATGLPPTPEQTAEFLNDKSPDAYEKYVDRLLASPRYGEARARYWLDAARYADSNGIHFDNYREMWPFRDWVIKAFNRNQPFDQFTIEQLAGDLLPNATLDQQIASGFNRCNITTNEAGVIQEEYRVLYARDRTETTGQVWLGLTVGCAVCHDHKFDPLLQKDFYSLSAFFNNTTQPIMDGNRKDTPPTIFMPQPADRMHWDALAAEIPDVERQIAARKQENRPEFKKWLAGTTAEKIAASVPSEGLVLQARLNDGDKSKTVNMTVNGQSRALAVVSGVNWDAGHVDEQSMKVEPGEALEIADAGDFDRDQPFTAAAWVKLSSGSQMGSVMSRMDDRHDYRGWDMWIENGQVATHIINRWDSDAIKVLANANLKPRKWNHLMITYDGSGKAEGVSIYVNGERQQTTPVVNRLKGTIHTEVPFKIGQRNTTSRLDGTSIEDVRLYNRALSASEAARLAKASRAAWLATLPQKKRNKSQINEMFEWWLVSEDKASEELIGRLASLKQEQSAIRDRGISAQVMHEEDGPAMAYVLYRGGYDARREHVSAGTPGMLPPMPKDYPKNRLGLAEWLMRPENPLTARVTVNRFWQQLFGEGIVRSIGDFGMTGQPPSHEQLIDWLAVEFRESGWDIKHMFRLMLTSSTYRQAASVTPEKLEKDPLNHLLSRGPRFRMDAEMIRDYALAVSGLLSSKIGGPSVRPYQPPGIWESVGMPDSDLRHYVQDHGESLYRRSVYTLWRRAAPPASMDIFNAPTREVCTVHRERTNTPLQALVTLNDTQFVEAARILAQRALSGGGTTTDARLNFIAERLLDRPLKSEELAVVRSSLDDLSKHYHGDVADAKKLIAVGESPADAKLEPATLASWTMLCNELMNLDEVLEK